MKLAIISDIHANLPALEAVIADLAIWQPDLVAVAGDIVNRGPQPLECFVLVQQMQQTHGWNVIRGNHEGYVLKIAHPDSHPPTGLDASVRFNFSWSYHRLIDQIAAIRALPTQLALHAPDGSEIRVVHASMRSDRDNIGHSTPDSVLREQIHPAPALFCCGHTHLPLVRQIDQTLVVNAGSVGLPFDGDTRASYARLIWGQTGWHARIVRLEYDRERARQAYTESGYLQESGPMALIVLHEFETAHPRLSRWIRSYNPQVLAGELTPEEAVDLFLENENGENK